MGRSPPAVVLVLPYVEEARQPLVWKSPTKEARLKPLRSFNNGELEAVGCLIEVHPAIMCARTINLCGAGPTKWNG